MKKLIAVLTLVSLMSTAHAAVFLTGFHRSPSHHGHYHSHHHHHTQLTTPAEQHPAH